MNGSEGEVDAVTYRLSRFREAMLPVVLYGAGHQQQAAVFQGKTKAVAVIIGLAEPEQPSFTKAQTGNYRIHAKLRFIVGMPAHAVPAIAVPVE